MDWLDFFKNNGLALTIVAILLAGCVTYGPKLITAHLAFVEAARVALESMPEIESKRLVKFDLIHDEHGRHFSEVQKTNHALDRACNLIDCYATGQPNATEILAHTSEIRKALHG